ncbi:MAG TPA: hypothetical protein VIG88_03725 [Lysobacter sp.]
MIRAPLLALALIAATPLHAQQAAATKKLYCWTEGGRKVCGDALPASAVDSARTEINARSGLPTARLPRALTADEKAVADAEARAQAEADAAAEAAHRRLMAMVTTFATEADLRRSFDNRVVLNRDAIKTARMGIDGLREGLVSRLRRAGDAELNRRPVPRKIAEDIRSHHRQLLAQHAALAALQRESATIRAQMEEAVARYREVKPQGASASVAQPAG